MPFSLILSQIYYNLEDKSWIEEHSGTLGTIVVILLFITERIISSYDKKRELNRNWYYSVIVLPNLSNISAFFQKYSKVTGEAYLSISSNSTIDANTLQQLKAIHFKKLRDIIHEFDFEFLMTVYMFSLGRYDSLWQIIENTHDNVVIILDKQNLVKDDLDELNRRLKEEKSIFFNALYAGLKDRR